MKFKTITGGTEAEAIAKFPWLAVAYFEDAVIDITRYSLVWRDGTWECGTWKDGTWEGGFWEGGYWEGGTWKGGIWEGGTWKDGYMWSNINQKYEQITYKDGKFTV